MNIQMNAHFISLRSADKPKEYTHGFKDSESSSTATPLFKPQDQQYGMKLAI